MKKNNSGQIKRKRSDTLMGTIEIQYGVNFNTRSDMKLGNYLKQKGLPSMSKALDRVEKRSNKK